MPMDAFALTRLQASLSSDEQVASLKKINSFLRNDPYLDVYRRTVGWPGGEAAAATAAPALEDELPGHLKQRPNGTGFLNDRWTAMKRSQAALHEEQERLLGRGIKQEDIERTVGGARQTSPVRRASPDLPPPALRTPQRGDVSPVRQLRTPSQSMHVSGTAGLPGSPASPPQGGRGLAPPAAAAAGAAPTAAPTSLAPTTHAPHLLAGDTHLVRLAHAVHQQSVAGLGAAQAAAPHLLPPLPVAVSDPTATNATSASTAQPLSLAGGGGAALDAAAPRLAGALAPPPPVAAPPAPMAGYPYAQAPAASSLTLGALAHYPTVSPAARRGSIGSSLRQPSPEVSLPMAAAAAAAAAPPLSETLMGASASSAPPPPFPATPAVSDVANMLAGAPLPGDGAHPATNALSAWSTSLSLGQSPSLAGGVLGSATGGLAATPLSGDPLAATYADAAAGPSLPLLLPTAPAFVDAATTTSAPLPLPASLPLPIPAPPSLSHIGVQYPPPPSVPLDAALNPASAPAAVAALSATPGTSMSLLSTTGVQAHLPPAIDVGAWGAYGGIDTPADAAVQTLGVATRSVGAGTGAPHTPMFIARRLSTGLRQKQYRTADQFIPPEEPRSVGASAGAASPYSTAGATTPTGRRQTRMSIPHGASHVTIQEVVSLPPSDAALTQYAGGPGVAGANHAAPLVSRLSSTGGAALRGGLSDGTLAPPAGGPGGGGGYGYGYGYGPGTTADDTAGGAGPLGGKQHRTWSPPTTPPSAPRSRWGAQVLDGYQRRRHSSSAGAGGGRQSRFASPDPAARRGSSSAGVGGGSGNPFALNPFDLPAEKQPTPSGSDISPQRGSADPTPTHAAAAVAAPGVLSGYDDELVRQFSAAASKHWGQAYPTPSSGAG